ncbi:MAG: hypothetical protein ABIK08_00610 [Pseudomonadota bacterium]
MTPRVRTILQAALAISPLLFPLLFLTESGSWSSGFAIAIPDIFFGLPWSIGLLFIGPSLKNIFPVPYDEMVGVALLAACLIMNSYLLLRRKKISWFFSIFFISICIALAQAILMHHRAFD